MNESDDPLRDWLNSSPRPLARADLAQQIVRHATRQPQQPSRQHWLQRSLAELSYGWQIKLASLAFCGVLGVLVGQSQVTGTDSDLLLTAQMLDNALYPEDP